MGLPNRKQTAPSDSLGPSGPSTSKRTAPTDNLSLSGPSTSKRIVLANNPGPFSPSTSKRTAPADSPGPLNRKWTVPLDSPGTTCTGTACAGESPLLVKKQRHFNTSLLLNHVEWPTLDQLWDIVGDSKLQAFLKSQSTFEEYTSAACIFDGRMSFIVRDLPLNHLMVVF